MSIELDQAWLDQILQRYRARSAKREHPWTLYLIKALWGLPNGLSRLTAIDRVGRMRAEVPDLPEVEDLDRTVQSTFNHHSSQSAVFTRKRRPPEDDLFYSPLGKGSGKWAVHRDRAVAWLKRNGFDAP